MEIADLNGLSRDDAVRALTNCCTATAWAEAMADLRPFSSVETVQVAALAVWRSLDRDAWLDAFAGHPRIGEMAPGSDRHAEWSRREQEAAAGADGGTAAALRAANRAYEERFGHVYLVFATGKTAPDMLELCRSRLENPPEIELRVAAAEHEKITARRLERLLAG